MCQSRSTTLYSKPTDSTLPSPSAVIPSEVSDEQVNPTDDGIRG